MRRREHSRAADGSARYLAPRAIARENLPKLLEMGGYRAGDDGRYPFGHDLEPRLNWPNIAALGVWLLAVVTLLGGAVRSRSRRMKGEE